MTIYFTTSADSGTGSLRAAIASATSGDAIAPDPDVFPRGATIAIELSARLSVSNKSLTLDAGPRRVRLDGQGATNLLGVGAGGEVVLRGFDFVRGSGTNGGGAIVSGGGSATFERCLFAGDRASNAGGAIYVGANSSLALKDCAIFANRAGKGSVDVEATAAATIERCSLIGNFSDELASGYRSVRVAGASCVVSNSLIDAIATTARPTLVDSVVDKTPEEMGIVDVPAFSDVDEWTSELWQIWNPRLLASSPYATGSTSTGTFDLDGNARRANGAVGAFENVVADLYWIGRDAAGESVATASFASADGWAASRFADRGGTDRPNADSSLFVDANLALAGPGATGKLIVGGLRSVSLTDGTVGALELGLGAAFENGSGGVLTASASLASAITRATGSTTRLEGALNAESFVVPTDSTLELIGPERASFGALDVAGTLELGADVETESLTLAGTLVFPSSPCDRVFAATTSASVSSGATVSGSGYLALPSGVSTDGAALGPDIRVCEYGANTTAFRATAISAREVKLSWTSAQGYRPLIERRDGDVWTLIAANPIASSSASDQTIESTRSGRSFYRAFDGATWYYDDAIALFGAQYRVVSTWATADRAAQNWEAIVCMATTEETARAGQGITVLARIFDAFDEDETLGNDGSTVVAVKYSCYRCSNGLFETTAEPVEGHENVDAGTDCVLDALLTSDAWTLDDVGYNFVLTPDIRTNPLFPSRGEYRIKVEITLASGNPVVFCVPVTVADLD